MELYSWQGQDGEWVFSVLYGTITLKSWEEVQANPLDLDGVERRFLNMAVGERVLWGRLSLLTASGHLVVPARPPVDLQGRLREIAAECEVELSVPSTWIEESVD
jgi:hypothetical protein